MIVQPAALARLLRRVKEANLKGVVMNACFSATQAQTMRQVGFAMVLMENEIDDVAAIAFSASLYSQLSRGRSFENAFSWARDAYDRAGTFELNPVLLAPHNDS